MKYDDFKRLHELVDRTKPPGQVIMTFGKYKGHTIAEVYNRRNYCSWYLQEKHQSWKKVSTHFLSQYAGELLILGKITV